jgi:phosphonate transport system permease protein
MTTTVRPPSGLTELTELEQASPVGAPRGRSGGRRLWVLVGVAALAWALWDAGLGRQPMINPGGWTLLRKFWSAALHPDLSGEFLGSTWSATITTVAYAALGTALSLVLGVVLGVLISETWWRRSRGGTRPAWLVARLAVGVPRGIHEAVWALFLLNVLGRDPAVGVLSIAIPFGAITAKVYAELIDEAAGPAYEALRAAGAGRVVGLAYAVFPQTVLDLVSYAFYRLECSVRSSVILGMIGAGGLGFELSLTFQSLAWRQMWTLLYAIAALSALTDVWGSSLRRAPTRRRVQLSVAAAATIVLASAYRLAPDLGRLFSARTRGLFSGLASEAWPPRLPGGGWSELLGQFLDTVQLSLVAIALASAGAFGAAFLAARGSPSPVGRVSGVAARGLLLTCRAIPPPVWALLVLFVIFPGPLPGALALGLYNFGILGRLWAEVVENLDARPGEALRRTGAAGATVFAYATVPLAAGRFSAYSLYRWEIAARESVVVGVVGAGGLGQLLEQQKAAFDIAGMLATVLALLALSVAVDLVSSAVRRSLR